MKENSISGDNRFEIIEKAKEMLLNATNIEDSKEEMKVLTNILFRMWQAGLINEEKLEINKLQKENSREEDIEELKRLLYRNELSQYGKRKLINYYEQQEKDYKIVLQENEYMHNELDKQQTKINKYAKENEELKDKYATFVKMSSEVIANSVPIQKVKDIIDRIDYDIKKTKEIISNNSNIYTSDRKNDYQIIRLRAMNTKSLDIKERLQKLIKESEE